MKLSGVIKCLEEGTDCEYETTRYGLKKVLSAERGYFDLKIYDTEGKLVSSAMPGGGFSGNLKTDDNWQPVRKEVSFIDAVNSGKCIKPVKPINMNHQMFSPVKYWLEVTALSLVEINGQWYIEE
jgi:hypothetical protein